MTSNRRSVPVLAIVPMVGMTYFASFAAALVIRSLVVGAALASYQLFFIPLAVFSAISAIAVWWKRKAGFAAAATMSLVLISIFFLTRDGNDVVTVLSNPARNVTQTLFYATSVPQFFTTFIFSVVGLLNLRHRADGIA